MLSSCAIIDLVDSIISEFEPYDRALGYYNLDVTTQYGDNLHFEFDTAANLHHEFIDYYITLLDTGETENNCVHIVADDQDQFVYDDPILIFCEIDSKDGVNLYKIEGAYIFVYDNSIYHYSQGYEPFESCYDIDAIDRFKEVILSTNE